MEMIFLKTLNIEGELKVGYTYLYDRGNHKHMHKTLYVPGYGFVPCSRRLLDDFTTDSSLLALVITEPEEKGTAYSSNIWITKPQVHLWDYL